MRDAKTENRQESRPPQCRLPASIPPEAAAIRGCPYKALLNTVEIEKAAYKMHAKPLPAPCIPHRRCAVSHPCTQPLARCGSFQRLESEMNTGVCPGRKNHKVDHQENRQNSSQRGQCPAPARFAEQYKQHCDRKAANDNGRCRPFGKTHKCKTAQKNRQIHPTHIKASAGHFCKQDHKNRNKTAAVPCAFTFVMRCIIFVLPKLPVPFVRAVHRLAQLNKNMAKVNNNALFRWPR